LERTCFPFNFQGKTKKAPDVRAAQTTESVKACQVFVAGLLISLAFNGGLLNRPKIK
jgi:hypothetical protein